MVKSEEEMREFDATFFSYADKITFFMDKLKKRGIRQPIFTENSQHMEDERKNKRTAGIENSQPSGDKD